MKLGKLLYIMLLEDLSRGITLSLLKKFIGSFTLKNKVFCRPIMTKSLNVYKIYMNHILKKSLLTLSSIYGPESYSKKIPLDTF